MSIINRAELKNGENVWMIERRSGKCLALKPEQAAGIRGDIFRQDFQRDSSSQTTVFGQIHFAHATFAEFRDDAVMRKRRIGCEFVVQLFPAPIPPSPILETIVY